MINQKLRTIVGKDMASLFVKFPWVVGIGIGFNGCEDIISVVTKDKSKTLSECVPATWLQFPIILNYDSFSAPENQAPNTLEPEEIIFE